MNKPISLVEQAHIRLSGHLKPGSVVVDATVGNGYDTQFLAQHVTESGHVYGFDIQSAALDQTRIKLVQNGLYRQVQLILDNHANMVEHIHYNHIGHIQAIIFNLGYLPGSDKSVITQTNSTLAALNTSLNILSPGGMLNIIAYPGHAGGKQESMAVCKWSQQLNPDIYQVAILASSATNTKAPKLITIQSNEN